MVGISRLRIAPQLGCGVLREIYAALADIILRSRQNFLPVKIDYLSLIMLSRMNMDTSCATVK